MKLEITTDLKLGTSVIGQDAIVEIHGNFNDHIDAAGDWNFELEDWDIESVSWDALNGERALISCPVHKFGATEQQRELDKAHRKQMLELLEAIRPFIPLTDADIEAALIAEYKRNR